MDLSEVDWKGVGETIAVALVAGTAAFQGAKRVLSKGLKELLRPAIQHEVSAALRKSMKEALRATIHEEVEPLREEVEAMDRRLARLEGAVDALIGQQQTPTK